MSHGSRSSLSSPICQSQRQMVVTYSGTRLSWLSLTKTRGCHSQRQTAVTHSGRRLSLTAADGCHSQTHGCHSQRQTAVTHSGRRLSFTAADGCHSQRHAAVTHTSRATHLHLSTVGPHDRLADVTWLLLHFLNVEVAPVV